MYQCEVKEKNSEINARVRNQQKKKLNLFQNKRQQQVNLNEQSK